MYFLRTAQHSSSSQPGRFTELYIRHHGGGINAIMLVAAPPKFLRFHLSEVQTAHDGNGRAQLATSWKHPGRTWSFVLLPTGYSPTDKLGRWEEVQIVESLGEDGHKSWDEGFEWIKDKASDGTEREILVHRSGSTDSQDGASSFRGWLVSEWCYGHPQLFWVTGEFKDSEMKLPPHCERVDIVREPVTGQPEHQE
jgi:hypothetical protein